MAGPEQVEEHVVVPDQHRHAVARLEAPAPQHVREAARALLELRRSSRRTRRSRRSRQGGRGPSRRRRRGWSRGAPRRGENTEDWPIPAIPVNLRGRDRPDPDARRLARRGLPARGPSRRLRAAEARPHPRHLRRELRAVRAGEPLRAPVSQHARVPRRRGGDGEPAPRDGAPAPRARARRDPRRGSARPARAARPRRAALARRRGEPGVARLPVRRAHGLPRAPRGRRAGPRGRAGVRALRGRASRTCRPRGCARRSKASTTSPAAARRLEEAAARDPHGRAPRPRRASSRRRGRPGTGSRRSRTRRRCPGAWCTTTAS